MLTRAMAFVRRDLTVELSYRLSFLMNLTGIFFSVASFFFLSKLFAKATAPMLAPYGGDYFAFVLIGIAFLGLQGTGLGVFSSAIGGAQSEGTLEAILVTPTRLSSVLLLSSLWSFAWTVLVIIIYLAFGSLVFGADLGKANWPAAAAVMTISVAIFSGVGVISGSVIMVLKRGDPVSWLFGSLSKFLGGTFFPVTILPAWLQVVAHVVPVFYTLQAMRKAVLVGASIPAISGDLAVLAAYAAVILPLSVAAFRYAVGVAKTDGSLGTY